MGVRVGYFAVFGVGLLTFVAFLTTTSQRGTAPIPLSDHQLVSGSSGSPRFPSLSPDGRTLAFVDEVEGRAQVWVQSVRDGPATQITFVDQIGLEWTRWSTSGDQIYFNYGGGICSVLRSSRCAPRIQRRGVPGRRPRRAFGCRSEVERVVEGRMLDNGPDLVSRNTS